MVVGGLDQRSVEVGLEAGGCRDAAETGDGDVVVVDDERESCRASLVCGGGLGDGVEACGAVVADELGGAVDDHLRGVVIVEVEGGLRSRAWRSVSWCEEKRSRQPRESQ